MAAGPIFNALADLYRLDQPATLERIVAVSAATMANTVISLKANIALLVTNEDNIRLNVDLTDGWEAGLADVASSWNGT